MDKVVTLIFTHKAEPDEYERLSFQQCFKVLGKHPIRLVCPKGMDISRYREMVPGVVPDFIDPKWFKSLRDYNLLKVLPWLYRRYAGYEFMLSYELDAWVFRDELIHWCEQGWDYIGAPWFEAFYECRPDAGVFGVGNSGFSLRRIPSIRRALVSMGMRKLRRVLGDIVKRRESFRNSVARLRAWEKFYDPFHGWIVSDDLYWCVEVAPKLSWLRIAPYEAARRFSFEANAPRLYAENGQNLPFGCHKYLHLTSEWWKRFIPRAAESAEQP
jgi:hypothetical protein